MMKYIDTVSVNIVYAIIDTVSIKNKGKSTSIKYTTKTANNENFLIIKLI